MTYLFVSSGRVMDTNSSSRFMITAWEGFTIVNIKATIDGTGGTYASLNLNQAQSLPEKTRVIQLDSLGENTPEGEWIRVKIRYKMANPTTNVEVKTVKYHFFQVKSGTVKEPMRQGMVWPMIEIKDPASIEPIGCTSVECLA